MVNSMDDVSNIKEKLELDYKKIMQALTVSAIFSFSILEITFHYLINGGISKFPENLIVFLTVGSFFLIFENLLFSVREVVLTTFATLLSIIFIINTFFQNSPNPSIIVSFFSLNRAHLADNIFLDYIVIGMIGGVFWIGIIGTVISVIKKAGKVSMKDTYGSMSKKTSAIIDFFDDHPWAVTALIALITGILGIIIGSIK